MFCLSVHKSNLEIIAQFFLIWRVIADGSLGASCVCSLAQRQNPVMALFNDIIAISVDFVFIKPLPGDISLSSIQQDFSTSFLKVPKASPLIFMPVVEGLTSLGF